MKRSIDALGRLVIPKAFREELGIKTGCDFELFADKEKGLLILKKECAVCFSFGSKNDLLSLKNEKYLCKSCLAKLK